MTFDKTQWQREYRKKKRMEKITDKENEVKETDAPENLDKNTVDDPDLSLDDTNGSDNSTDKGDDNSEKPKSRKVIKEDVKKPPVKKGKKKGEMIALNPEAFAKMSVGIEKLTLQVHKDKDLKDAEQDFIVSSATQVAELYEMPKIIVLLQYGAAMVFPHVTRILKAQAEKMELENAAKKIDLEEKKRKVQEGRKEIKTEDVYKSVMPVAN